MSEDEVHLNLNLPESMHAGVYADAAMVWHAQNGFTIDFIAGVIPPQPDPAGGELQQPATVVSRVRVPVGVIFQVARAISENVANYEAKYGKIGPPGGPDHPPEEEQ